MLKKRPILYSFRRCPYAMRARMALIYSHIQCELREVDLKRKPQAMLDISPKGTVPVLQLLDGRVIEESLEIMDYALSAHDPDGWAAHGGTGPNALIECNDKEFAAILRKYKYHERHPEASQQDYRAQCEEVMIKVCDERLRITPYLAGDGLSKADIAIFPFIRQFAMVDQDWFDASPYESLRLWLNTLLQARWYEEAMAKHNPWQEGQVGKLLFAE